MSNYHYPLLVLLLLFCISVSACSESGTTTPVVDKESYENGDCYDAPGVVIIAFEKKISDAIIRDFISSLGLEIQGRIYFGDQKWVTVGVVEGTEDEWIDVLLTYENVTTAGRDKICPVL